MSKRKQKYPVKERTVTALQLRSPVTLQRPDSSTRCARGNPEDCSPCLTPARCDYGTRTQFAWVAPD